MLDICLLGTGGMMPLPKRFLTSLLLRYEGEMLLIDCGEATQISLKMLGWGFKNIGIMCFTHYHADHISGLPGMLLTLANSGRTEPLNLIGPKGLERVVNALRTIAQELTFDLVFHEVNENKPENIKIGDFIIDTLPAMHTSVCVAYSVNIERRGKFNLEKAEDMGVPKEYWNKLQNGVAVGGYTPSQIMGEKRKGFKISYCTDSRPTKEMPKFIKNSDIFICEGMYGDDSELKKACERKHMVFSEAAQLAAKGSVSELWLTHFSPALTNPIDYIDVAKNIFSNTVVGTDRMTKTLNYKDRD